MVRSITFFALLSSTAAWANCPEQAQANYDASRPGLVTDKKSGLTWMRCALGSDWNKGSCSGVPSRLEWKEAQQNIDAMNKEGGYGGHKDWRLPTLAELSTLINKQCFHPAIDSHSFPETQGAGYWSADSDKVFPDAAALVHFYHGSDYITSKNKTWFVRAVRK